MHLPMLCSNLCATATIKTKIQQLLAVRMANTMTSTVDEQLPTHAQGFQHSFPCRKKQSGNP